MLISTKRHFGQWWWKLLLIAAVGCQCRLQSAESKIYFQENFRNYRDTCPLCTADLGIEVGNDPVWTQSAEANCRLKATGFIFKEYVPQQKTLKFFNYDVMFKFRFLNDGEKRFELRLRHETNGKTADITVALSANEVKVSSETAGVAQPAQAVFSTETSANNWHTCLVKVADGKLNVFVDEQRALKQVIETKVSAGSCAGMNFHGNQGASFSLSNIVLREPAPLPDTSITNLLPAPMKDDLAGYKSGAEQKETTIEANDIFGATIKTGLEKNSVKLAVNWEDGRKNEITFSVAGIQAERKVKKDGKDVTEKFQLPDAVIEIKGITNAKSQLNYHIRPMLRRYHTSYSFTETYHDIIRDLELLPKASETPVKVEFKKTTSGVDILLNARFAGSIQGGAAKNVVFTLAPAAAIRDVTSSSVSYSRSKFTPLDVGALRKAKAFADATASLKTGFTNLENVPMIVTAGNCSADIGLTREGQGNWALEVDEYLARSPFDGLLTEVHLTVPGAAYTKAWVLCAVDPDPSKDPIFTTRLARYVESGVGNNMLADTVTRLPRGDEKPGPGMKKVGIVSKPTKDGKAIEVPLYLVEVPLNSGKIIDLLNQPSLNFEFFGKPWENFEQIDNSSKPDPNSVSAVQIFGVTLEKSLVGLELVQAQPGNIFFNDETPETTVVLNSFDVAKGKLTWTILDVDGKEGGTGAADYSFTKAGESLKVNIPLRMPQLGWYELRVSLQNESGKTLLEHPARFALLGKDERKAGYESPYGIWWFDGVHGTPSSLEFGAKVMFKAGIRQAAWTSRKEKDLEKWFITKDQINMPFKFDDLKNPEAAFKRAEETISKALKDYPHLREVLVFHESGPGNDVPLELIGIKPALSEARIAREKRYADLFNMAGKFFREKFPQLRIVVGNNSCSQAVVAAIFRHGGKPEYMDAIGIEAPAQVYIPEKLQEWGLQGLNIAKDTAKTLTGRDIPATGCYEFTYRCERDMGEQQQAEWYTRDVLISLANNFTRIGPGILFDCSNAYYNGLWGGSGIMQRGPFGYPKKAYVAYATLTSVLDQVKFIRQIPTGSTTVYALEFARPDRKVVTVLWTARGQSEFILASSGEIPAGIVDMYGRSREVKVADGKLVVMSGTAPIYVISEKAFNAVSLGKRSFPKDEARASLGKVVATLDRSESLTLDSDNSLDTPKTFPLQTPIRQKGDIVLRDITDDQRGACVEIEMQTAKSKDVSKYITEYAVVRLKEPATVSGEPAALGVWVKGNSNWGRVLFEIEDAEGEIWKSIGTGGWGCDVLDWPGNSAVNFDGWNFVSLPLRQSPLFNDHSPGSVSEQWVSSGGNKSIDYPIKIKALIVEMNRQALDLLNFRFPKPIIRLGNIASIEIPADK